MDIKLILEMIEHIMDLPQGCQCPNNGGGDCEWCQEVWSLRTEIESSKAEANACEAEYRRDLAQDR